MSDEATSQHPDLQRRKRRTLLLDKEWQLSVFRNIAVVALIAGLIQMASVHFLSGQNPLQRWSGEEIGFLALASNLLFLAIVFIGLWVVALRLTHSVVGPALIIRRAVDEMLQGRFDSRLSLRKRDYLTELASSVQALSDHLAARVEATNQLSIELERALAAGDVELALQISQDLRSAPEESSAQERRCAA